MTTNNKAKTAVTRETTDYAALIEEEYGGKQVCAPGTTVAVYVRNHGYRYGVVQAVDERGIRLWLEYWMTGDISWSLIIPWNSIDYLYTTDPDEYDGDEHERFRKTFGPLSDNEAGEEG